MEDVGAGPTRHTIGEFMIKIGAKVLDKVSKDEYKYVGIREDEDGTIIHTFERKADGNTYLRSASTDRVEKLFYFLVEDHPSVKDVDRKKNKKAREKVTQPTKDSEPSALSLLN
jgi:hypothetical protein